MTAHPGCGSCNDSVADLPDGAADGSHLWLFPLALTFSGPNLVLQTLSHFEGMIGWTLA